jgi:hypothetical protein
VKSRAARRARAVLITAFNTMVNLACAFRNKEETAKNQDQGPPRNRKIRDRK